MGKINDIYSNQQILIEKISQREVQLKINDFCVTSDDFQSKDARKAIVCTTPQEKDLLAIALDRLGLTPNFENLGSFKCRYAKNGHMNQAIKSANVFDNFGRCYMFLDTTLSLDNVYTFSQIDFENVLKPNELKKLETTLSK